MSIPFAGWNAREPLTPPAPEQLELDFSKEPNPQDVCDPRNRRLTDKTDAWDAANVGATYVPDIDPFSLILGELELLHNKKRADYGSKTDPYANVRASSEFGIPPWIGVMVRANDKVKRIKAAAMGSTMQNESIIDSFNDLAVYAIIARILYEANESLENVHLPKCQVSARPAV